MQYRTYVTLNCFSFLKYIGSASAFLKKCARNSLKTNLCWNRQTKKCVNVQILKLNGSNTFYVPCTMTCRNRETESHKIHMAPVPRWWTTDLWITSPCTLINIDSCHSCQMKLDGNPKVSHYIGGNCQHRTINKLTISRGVTLCRKKPSTPIWSPPGLECPMYKIELSWWKYPQSPPLLTYAFCIIYHEVSYSDH